jgi:hypothetical protein
MPVSSPLISCLCYGLFVLLVVILGACKRGMDPTLFVSVV